MRRILLAMAAASVVASAAAVAPANAMMPGSASGFRAAAEDIDVLQDAGWVCRRRSWSSRRSCYYVRPKPVYRYKYRYRRW